MKTVKYSRQREAIREFLMGNTSHPTADEVYAAIRRQFPSISLGTVYRNLNLLSENGEIKKLSYTTGPDHFDYDTSRHYHFVCRECGRVYDMPLESIEAVNRAAEEYAPGAVDSHELVFYGVCNACLGRGTISA